MEMNLTEFIFSERSVMNSAAKTHALYIRVSTEAQADEGYSIDAQKERLQAYCTAKGWPNAQTYIDGGFTGSNLNRPAMTQLIADAKAGKLASVIVYKLDRLSRSQKDTLYLIEDVFLPNEIDFISLNESIDTSTPYGRAMIGILSAFAQLERENIYMRTRMGMLERVKQGYWRGGGGVPFGYDYDREKGVLVPNENAETVRKMYELYIKGYSTQKIASMLGLKHERLVSLVLVRRSNLGYIRYNGEEYKGNHEPIVSEAIYEQAMEKMRERSKSPTPVKASHLLTGLLYCGCCGARLRYQKWGKSGYKLVCYSSDPSKPHMVKDPDCRYKPVWAHQVESILLDDLFRISADINHGADGDDFALLDPMEDIEKRIRQTESKLERLYALFAEDGENVLLNVINKTKASLAVLKAELQTEAETQTQMQKLSLVREQVSGIRDTWPYLSDLQRQSMIRDCVSRIVVTNERLQIYYTFKNPNEKTHDNARSRSDTAVFHDRASCR